MDCEDELSNLIIAQHRYHIVYIISKIKSLVGVPLDLAC